MVFLKDIASGSLSGRPPSPHPPSLSADQVFYDSPPSRNHRPPCRIFDPPPSGRPHYRPPGYLPPPLSYGAGTSLSACARFFYQAPLSRSPMSQTAVLYAASGGHYFPSSSPDLFNITNLPFLDHFVDPPDCPLNLWFPFPPSRSVRPKSHHFPHTNLEYDIELLSYSEEVLPSVGRLPNYWAARR